MASGFVATSDAPVDSEAEIASATTRRRLVDTEQRPETPAIVAPAAMQAEGRQMESADDKKTVNYARGGNACGPLAWATAGHHLMPYHPSVYRDDWTQLLREVLAGITVAFAQVSDSIAFAFIAGVGPLLGLHAAWIIGFTMSAIGSRPGMINGATGVRAAVLAPYVATLGVGYLFYIVIAISVFQFLASFLSLAKFVRLVTRPVMIGFLCGLAYIMARGQIPAFYIPQTTTFNDSTTILWQCFIVVVTLLGMVAWPFVPTVGKALPPPLIGIFLAMALEFGVVRGLAGHKTPVVADLGKVSGGFPLPFWQDPQWAGVLPPFTLEVFVQVLQPAFVAAAAGMVEAVMTMEVANDMTETDNPAPDQQLLALGIGNLLCGLFGTMGGGATIGPTVIACSNGANGRYRLSGIVAAVVLLLIILVASDVVAIIPTSALVAVMAVVCWATFEWSMPPMVLAAVLPKQAREYLGFHRKVRRMDALVMVVVTAVTIFLDLFTAVLVGVGISAVDFSWQQAKEVRIFPSLVPFEPGDAEKLQAIHDKEKAANAEESETKADDSATTDQDVAIEMVPVSRAKQSDDAKVPEAHPASAAAAASTATPMTPTTTPDDSNDGADPEVASSSSSAAAAPAKTDDDSSDAAEADAVAIDVDTGLDDDSDDREETEEATASEPQKRVYVVSGCLFFASAMDFVKYFSPAVVKGDPELVEFRFEDAAIGDYSGMHALGVVAEKYQRVKKHVFIKRLGLKSFKLVQKADHLIQHFQYELDASHSGEDGEAGDEETEDGSVHDTGPHAAAYEIDEGEAPIATPMHIQATQSHLRV